MKINGYEFYGNYIPMKHQEHTIKFMLANKRGYVLNDMGTGKTASCLWFADILMTLGKIRKVLIIAPLSTLRSVWVKDILEVCPYRKYHVVHGSREERAVMLKDDANFYITNTDAPRNFFQELMELKPDVIIIDEITSFANSSSKRSKAMQSLARNCLSVYGLSGNPTAGGLMQSYGIAKVVLPGNLPTPYMSKYRDMILYQVNLYEYVPKEGATRIVNKVLSPAIRYKLEDCVDLPPINFIYRSVDLPAPTMKLFREMLEHQIAEYKEGLITAQTAGVKAIRLMQILTGSTKDVDGNIHLVDITPKLLDLLSIYYEAGMKLVVFAQSVKTVQIIRDFFRSKGVHAEHIWGDVSLKERDRIISDFQTKSEGVLCAQVKTMSHGVTLTKAHTLVFFGPVAGNETYRQAIRRIRRISQKHKQTVIRLISTKFEKRAFEKLDQMEFTSQEVMDMYNEGIDAFL